MTGDATDAKKNRIVNAMSWATDAPGGFTEADVELFRDFVTTFVPPIPNARSTTPVSIFPLRSNSDGRTPVGADLALQPQAPRHVDIDRDGALLWRRAGSDADAHIIGYVTRGADCRSSRAHLYVERIAPRDFRTFSKASPPPSPEANCAAVAASCHFLSRTACSRKFASAAEPDHDLLSATGWSDGEHYLILKRASLSRPSGEWIDDDFDVLADGEVVGRIFKANAAPVGTPWMWTLAFGHHEDPQDLHAPAAVRVAC
jgi:hypothetical protein